MALILSRVRTKETGKGTLALGGIACREKWGWRGDRTVRPAVVLIGDDGLSMDMSPKGSCWLFCFFITRGWGTTKEC